MDLSVLSIIPEIGAIGLLLALGATVAAIAIAWLFGMVLNPDLALRGLKISSVFIVAGVSEYAFNGQAFVAVLGIGLAAFAVAACVGHIAFPVRRTA